MDVTRDEKIVFQGTRDVMKCLWRVTIQILDRTTHQSNNIHQVNGNENSIKYLHTVTSIPVQYTLTRYANRGYFNTWPGLTEKDINKMTKANETIKGHLEYISNHK